MPPNQDLPVVECSPTHRFGHPRVRGVDVTAYAERVWAGDPVDGVAADFGVCRGDVLIACWYVARHGEGDGFGLRTKMRAGWQPWLQDNSPAFHRGDWDQVTDPPTVTDSS